MLQIDCESRIERVVVYARGAVVTRAVTLPGSLPEGALELCLGGITALAEPGSVRAPARGEREVTAIKARVAIPEAPVKAGRLREQVRALGLEYAARLSAAATRVSFGIDAFVAQASGEAWSGVELSVATADLASDVRLPELRSLRIGRAQTAPRKGCRPPPAGLEAMFEGHDRAVNQADFEHPREEAPARESDEGDRFQTMTRSAPAPEEGRLAGPHGMAMPRPASAPSSAMATPMQQAMSAPRRESATLRAKSGGLGGMVRKAMAEPQMEMDAMAEDAGSSGMAFARAEPVVPTAIEPDEAWLDFDALTIGDPLAPENRGRRGRLARDPSGVNGSRAAAARATIEALGSPPEARDPLETRGKFDHRYDAEGKADVPSNGLPHRVTIGSAEGEARPRFIAVVFPELARVAHLRATATLTRGGPLLAGPVRIARGQSLIGRARLDFVGEGEPFEVGLGTDDGVRVRRSQTDQRETTPVTGTQKIKRAVKVFLSNLSSEARRVVVTERLPVSEIDDVEITLTTPGGFRNEGHDGFLLREVDLGPNATQTLEIAYELRASSKVVLPM